VVGGGGGGRSPPSIYRLLIVLEALTFVEILWNSSTSNNNLTKLGLLVYIYCIPCNLMFEGAYPDFGRSPLMIYCL